MLSKRWFKSFCVKRILRTRRRRSKINNTWGLSSAVQFKTCTERGHLDVQDIERYPILCYSRRAFPYNQYIFQQMHFVIQYTYRYKHSYILQYDGACLGELSFQKITEDGIWVPKYVRLLYICYVGCITKCICWKIY